MTKGFFDKAEAVKVIKDCEKRYQDIYLTNFEYNNMKVTVKKLPNSVVEIEGQLECGLFENYFSKA